MQDLMAVGAVDAAAEESTCLSLRLNATTKHSMGGRMPSGERRYNLKS